MCGYVACCRGYNNLRATFLASFALQIMENLLKLISISSRSIISIIVALIASLSSSFVSTSLCKKRCLTSSDAAILDIGKRDKQISIALLVSISLTPKPRHNLVSLRLSIRKLCIRKLLAWWLLRSLLRLHLRSLRKSALMLQNA